MEPLAATRKRDLPADEPCDPKKMKMIAEEPRPLPRIVSTTESPEPLEDMISLDAQVSVEEDDCPPTAPSRRVSNEVEPMVTPEEKSCQSPTDEMQDLPKSPPPSARGWKFVAVLLFLGNFGLFGLWQNAQIEFDMHLSQLSNPSVESPQAALGLYMMERMHWKTQLGEIAEESEQHRESVEHWQARYTNLEAHVEAMVLERTNLIETELLARRDEVGQWQQRYQELEGEVDNMLRTHTESIHVEFLDRLQELERRGLVPCFDEYAEDCQQWAIEGECEGNAAYMSWYCRKSCGHCSSDQE